MAAPTTSDAQCSMGLISRNCSAAAGYDSSTCVPYAGRCYTTYQPAQCSAHSDCSTSWTGECTNRSGASSLFCRHTGAFGACECVAPMFSVRMWPSSIFPEQCTPGLIPAGATLSIALSGGGCRALSAALGMFRYLRSVNQDRAARYVSSVSGGSWFYGLYSFAQVRGYTAASLLGASRAPAAITLANLDEDNFQAGSAFIGVPCTNADLISYMLAALVPANNVPVDESWNWTMGQIFLKPYGLHENVPIAASAEHAASIEARNRQLGPALVPVAGSPFWLSNVVFQHSSIPDSEKFPSGVMTPLYSGMAAARVGSVNVGGVSLETFGLGTNAPSVATISAIRSGACAGVTATIPAVRNEVVSLKGMIGVSSAAYIGWVLDKLPVTSGLLPAYNMWPLSTSGSTASTTMFAGDGAMVDNTGILPLLARGERKIVALLSASEVITAEACTSNINHLFGTLSACTVDYSNAGVRTAQVFKSSDFPAFKAQLLSTRAAGGPCFARANLAVQPNAIQGVRGGYTVSLLMVVLQPCAQFNALLPAAVRAEFAAGKSLANFPLFKTMVQNPPNVIQYTKRQVNLLASQVDWMFRQASIQTAMASL